MKEQKMIKRKNNKITMKIIKKKEKQIIKRRKRANTE